MQTKIYDFINQLIDDKAVIGMVCSIITKESRELFFVGESEENKAATLNTIYDLASVSKVVGTLSAILKLIEEGYFTLDTKVKDILVDYKYDSTVLDLLLHQSGLPADDKDYRNSSDYRKFVFDLELTYEPRSKVEYSDFGYNLLGFIIEYYKGNINDYLSEILFKPLEMLNTTYLPSTLEQDLIAPSEIHATRGKILGEVMDGKAHMLNGLSGNAGLFSNINDLSNYLLMLLNNGSLFNQEIFKSETINLFKESFTKSLNIDRTLGYIISDERFDFDSERLIYHTGFSGPMILVDFKHEFAVAILCNRTYPDRSNTKIIEERFKLVNLIYDYLSDIKFIA